MPQGEVIDEAFHTATSDEDQLSPTVREKKQTLVREKKVNVGFGRTEPCEVTPAMKKQFKKVVNTYAASRPPRRPEWMTASRKQPRELMVEVASKDTSDLRFDVISYARHHAVKERARYHQMVRAV